MGVKKKQSSQPKPQPDTDTSPKQLHASLPLGYACNAVKMLILKSSRSKSMKNITILILALFAGGVTAAEGLITITSPHGVQETTDRLEKAVTEAGFTVAVRWNHAKGAEKVGLKLAPEEILIFGKPKAGTLLMQSNPTAGIDLPMKYLVWQGTDGKTQVAWNDPAWIARRHGITDRAELIARMQAALRKIAEKAAAP